jgi:hypothetical protein
VRTGLGSGRYRTLHGHVLQHGSRSGRVEMAMQGNKVYLGIYFGSRRDYVS